MSIETLHPRVPISGADPAEGRADDDRRRWRNGASTGNVVSGLRTVCASCERVVVRPDGGELTELVSPETAASVLVPRFGRGDRERCLVAMTDTKHRLLEVVTVSIGSLDRTFMSPREVFRDALLANAAALVLAHNHPSGDPEPSRDDEAVTRRLVRAGELIGVDVLDHLVIGGERWVSLARRGAI